MSSNKADGNGNDIYNNNKHDPLNLIFISNSTIIVVKNGTVTLWATLTDDMGNTVSGQNISFVINGTFIGTALSIEGRAELTYTANLPSVSYVVTREYDDTILNGTLLVVDSTAVKGNISLDKGVIGVKETVNGVITVVNDGNETAYNVNVKLDIPDGLTIDDIVVIEGTFDPKTNTSFIGDLALGETVTLEFTAKSSIAGNYTISTVTSGDNFNTTDDSANVEFKDNPEPVDLDTLVSPSGPDVEPKSSHNGNVVSEVMSTDNTASTGVFMQSTGLPFAGLILAILSIFLVGYIRQTK